MREAAISSHSQQGATTLPAANGFANGLGREKQNEEESDVRETSPLVPCK